MATAVSMARQFGLKKLAAPSAGNAGGALAGLCCARRHRSAHFHAGGDSQGQRQRVPRTGRARHPHQRPHHRLWRRSRQAQGRRRLVRRLHPQRALSRRGQEDPRLRTRRATRLGFARRCPVSDRRWHRPRRHVEGFRRDAGSRWAWIGPKRPRMFTVQAERLPAHQMSVRALQGRREISPPSTSAPTIQGFRPARAEGDWRLPSCSTCSANPAAAEAVAVTDDEMIASVREVGAAEGLFVAPEGAATYAALKHLLAAKTVRPDESIVLFNTGAGVKLPRVLPSLNEVEHYRQRRSKAGSLRDGEP